MEASGLVLPEDVPWGRAAGMLAGGFEGFVGRPSLPCSGGLRALVAALYVPPTALVASFLSLASMFLLSVQHRVGGLAVRFTQTTCIG